MKYLIFFLCCTMTCTIKAQIMNIAETDIQMKKGDSLVKNGVAKLSEFMVLRDTAKHTHAVKDFAAAKAIYDHCMANGTVPDNDWGMTGAMILDAKLMIVNSYITLYDASYRDELMAEPEKDRSKKVEYNGTEYKVSKDTKENFELLNPKK